MDELQIGDLQQDPQNARKHGKRNLKAIEDSFKAVGAARSVVLDENNVLLAGNASAKGAAAAGISKVLVVDTDGDTLVAVRRTGLTTEQKSLLALYDNRAAELADGWDVDVLRKLESQGVALDGMWTADELAAMFGVDHAAQGQTDPDAVPAERPTDIKPGDVFELGRHRIVCGDSTKADDVARVLDGSHIDLVVTSPPYNVNIKYRSHKDRAERDEYLGFISAIAAAFMPHLAKGRFVAWNIGVSPKTFPHHQVVALEAEGLSFYRQIVWAKSGVAYPVFPSTLRTKRVRHYKPNYTHEVIQVFESAPEDTVDSTACALCEGSGQMAVRELPVDVGHETVQLLTNGDKEVLGGDNQQPDKRYSNDVWRINQSQASVGLRTMGERTTGLQRRNGKSQHRVKEHPAAFPVELPRAVMSFLTGPDEVVFEPFGGSGSTIIACEQLGRKARVIELDPVYCQVAIDRWEAFTGKKAVKVGSL
jgi:DNA modification methylase